MTPLAGLIATDLTRHHAESARPDAPVVPDHPRGPRGPRLDRSRARTAALLHRVATAVEPRRRPRAAEATCHPA